MNVLCFFIAVDHAPPEFQNIEWGDALMKLFFKDISQEGLLIASNDAEGENFCIGWNGILCESEEIREISYAHFNHGNFNVNALPPSTTNIIIETCGQTFQIDTRSLPRNLTEINLRDNKITGRLDLTTLPENLEYANFSDNVMTGPVELTRLPNVLRQLYLHENEISQRTVLYDNLPAGIQVITLGGPLSTNSIGKVRAVHSENAVKKKGIFYGMKEANVH